MDTAIHLSIRIIIISAFLMSLTARQTSAEVNFLSPEGIFIGPKPVSMTPTPTPTPTYTKVKSVFIGDASFYSRSGCLGCSETLHMANGQILDDGELTVAFNYAPLNTKIEIQNVRNNKKVTAKVTDRGGFEQHGKIIDLSVATRDALGCGSICKIKIEREEVVKDGR